MLISVLLMEERLREEYLYVYVSITISVPNSMIQVSVTTPPSRYLYLMYVLDTRVCDGYSNHAVVWFFP
jgi:hypothetical protein